MMTRIYLGMPQRADISTIERLEDDLVGKVGSLTFMAGTGMWKDSDGHIVRKPCYIYEIMHEDMALIRAFAENMRVVLGQQEVLIMNIWAEKV